MSALDHTHLLEKLIINAERAVMQRPSTDREALARLCSSVIAECARPTDAKRVMGVHTSITVTALLEADMAMHHHDGKNAARYARLIGVLLPDLRADLLTAIDQRARPTP